MSKRIPDFFLDYVTYNITVSITMLESLRTVILLPPPRRICFRCYLSVCLLATLGKNFRTDLDEIFRKVWKWINEQIFKFWRQSGSPSGYRDNFPDSSLLGDMESGINRLRCATLQCTAGRYRHRNYDVITSPAHGRQPRQTCLGGGMHCLSASS